MNITINQSKSTNNPITLLSLTTRALQQMISDCMNKYEHASFVIFVSYLYKIEFFAKHLFCVLFKNNLGNFNISI